MPHRTGPHTSPEALTSVAAFRRRTQAHMPPAGDPLVTRWPAAGGGVAFAIFAFLSLMFLFNGVLQDPYNESVILPWSRQFVEPSWLPNDWFLNSPVGNQRLTAAGIGWLITQVGFLYAALTARLVAYALLAVALASLVRKLTIPLSYTLIVLWLFAESRQHIAAGEWIFGAAESKVFAYGCVLWGLSFLVEKRFALAFACLGLATSFHFLVGGYALFACLLVALYERISLRAVLISLGGYMVLAAVGIYNAASEVLQASGGPEVSYIVAYVSLPAHMVPASWSSASWWRPPVVGVGWIMAYWYTSRLEGPRRLLLFGAFTMVPFVGGLLVAPFDTHGTLLKCYPFRVGATLFLLIVSLCGYFVLYRRLRGRTLAVVLAIGLTTVMIGVAYSFARQVHSFDGKPSREHPWVEACTWIREMTPTDVVVLAPPAKASFTLLAQRAMVVQFKFFPFTQAEVLEWYRRLLDLTGGKPPSKTGGAAWWELNARYFSLANVEIVRLAKKYGAGYVLTTCDERHGLERVYANEKFCVYKPEIRAGSSSPNPQERLREDT